MAPAPTTFGELMECLEIVPRISQMPQWTSRPGSSNIRPESMKLQLKRSISGLEPAAEHDTSPLLKAKPDEPVSLYPCIEPPADHDIYFGFGRRHGDSPCVCRRRDIQTVIFDVISLWKVICLPETLCLSFILISVTILWDMIIRLCMYNGRMHHVKVLESKSHGKMAKTFNFYLQVTVKRQSKSYISDEIYKQNLSEWCHTCHRKRG